MSVAKVLARHRWFCLAVLFLLLNAYAVALYHSRVQGGRSLRVQLAAPRDGGLAGRDLLRWQCSQDMVAPASTGVWSSVGPVKLIPAVRGAFCWARPRELLFRPDGEWPPCTEFKAVVSDDLRSLDLQAPGGPAVFSAHTAALRLEGVSQIDYPDRAGPSFQFEFNAPVAPDAFREALSVANAAGEPLTFRIGQQSSGKRITVSLPRDPGSEIAFALRSGLQSTVGPRGLERAVCCRLAPARDLRVVSIEPETASFGPYSVRVAFNRPVLLESAADFVRTEPAVNLCVDAANRYGWRSPQEIRLAGDFKPGRSYEIHLLKGLPGSGGTSLPEDVTRTAYLPDAEPGLDIEATGNYMSPQGGMRLPFKTVGMIRCRVTLRRVYPNNLVYLANRQPDRGDYGYWRSYPGDGLTRDVTTRDIAIDADPNAIVEQTLSLRELTGGRLGAFYVLIDADNGKEHCERHHHVIVSDTGLTLKSSDGELLIWANSLRTLEPVANATVKVFSTENQELLAGLTDSNGFARLQFATNALSGTPFLVTAQKGDDLTYLALPGSEVSVAGAAGDRPYIEDGYEAYLFTDRGIYRPGETTHVKAVVRGRDATCPPPFPVRLNVYRPDGRLERTLNGTLTRFGTAEFSVAWPDFAATGRHRFDLTLPADQAALGSVQVAVEEFVPPQIRVAVKTPGERGRAGEEIPIDLCADYLFGRPAAGLTAEARVEFMSQPFAPPPWAGYTFGDPRKKFASVQQAAGRGRLTDRGEAHFAAKASPDWRPPAALKAVVVGTVTEIGGRAVSACAGQVLDVYPFYVGLRRGEGEVRVGAPHTFDVLAVAPDASVFAAAAKLKLTVEKLSWATVLRKGSDDTYAYASEQQASRVLAEEVALSAGKASIAFTPVSDGDYRLAVSDPASGASSSIEFHADAPGQHWGTVSMETPDRVELTFDKERYAAGETATLLVKAPFPGKALFTIESTHVLSQTILVLTNNTAEIKVAVQPEYAPNVYCAVTLIRPAAPEKLWSAHRAAGLASLLVDAPERKLRMTLDAPETLRPCQKVTVGIAVADGATNGVEAEVVLAAVDEGICELTDFETPDPYRFFFAPRQPGSALHDLYALLMPDLASSVGDGASSPGGDMMAGLSKRLNPVKARRFKPVALWSSTVVTDTHGKAVVAFDVPEFTGQLRLMAVAVDARRFASAERRVQVKRPLVVQSSLPRFVAPADRFRLPVRIMNETGREGEAVASVICGGPLMNADGRADATRRVRLGAGAETNLVFALAAQAAPGTATCRIEVDLAGERFAEEVEMPVRPPSGRVTFTGTGRVAAGQTEALEIPTAWLEGTGGADLWLSSLPAIELGGSLNYLLDYPYGCLEQTTSKSFPLLYLPALAEQIHPGWLERKDVANYVEAGLQRVLSMQRDDGSFSLWCGGETYPWGTIYATHFLVEAVKAGYALPDDRVKAACDYLEQRLSEAAPASDDAGADDAGYNRSYACYVLALAGRPQHGWMTRLREQEAKLGHDARVNLAAALIAAGKRREGSALIENVKLGIDGDATRQTGGSLRSSVRDRALLLMTWLDVDPQHASIPALVQGLEACRENGRWCTTQENAMALMALGKYGEILAQQRRPIAGQVAWRGLAPTAFAEPAAYHAAYAGRREGPLELRNCGAGPIYYCWKSEGVPLDGKAREEDRGLKVRRELLDLSGHPVASDTLPQGELFVLKVTLETDDAEVENIVVEDLLPAGLEIENADLKTSQTVSWCKDRQTLTLLHTDIRDDRMVAFAAPFCGKQTYFYAVRAVTPGEFGLPPIAAACMYDPDLRSIHGAGRIRVVAAEAP